MSQSWKKFGGIKQLDALNHLTVNSITTDEFAMRNPYNGTFAISGELFVFDDAHFQKNVDICNNLYVDDNVYIRDYLVMGKQYERGSEYSNFYEKENSTNYSHFFYSDNSGVGLNVHEPKAILDICGSHSNILNVFSASETTQNILAQNKDGNKISLEVDTSYSRIVFFHSDVSTSILYEPTQDQLRLPEQVVFGQYARDGTASLIVDENKRNTIPYWDSVEDVSLCTPLQVRSRDISTNATALFSNSEHKGWHIGGGLLPLDTQRQMGFMGWMDNSGHFVPSQVQVSGNYLRELKSSTGFNTFQPVAEKNAVDINGPIQIKHQELREAERTNFTIHSISFSKSNPLFGLAVGEANAVDTENKISYNTVYRTTDAGATWNAVDISFSIDKHDGADINESLETILGVHAFGTSDGIIASKAYEDLHYFTSSDQGMNWDLSYVNMDISGFFQTAKEQSRITPYAIDKSNIVFIQQDLSVNFLIMLNNGERRTSFHDTLDSVTFEGLQITSIDGSGNDIYTVDTSGNIIKHTFADGEGLKFDANSYVHMNGGAPYKFITVGSDHKLACGTNIISVEINNSSEYVDISFANAPVFNHGCVYDLSCAMVVGNNGEIYYTRTGIQDTTAWQAVSDYLIDGMGNHTMLRSYDIIHVHIRDPTRFTFFCDMSGTTRMIDAYLPDVWFPDDSPPLVFIEGHMETNREMIKIFDKNVSTVHLATEASNLYLDMCGNTHMNQSFHVESHHTKMNADSIHVTTNGNGITFDTLENKPFLKPNDKEKLLQVGLTFETLADLSNTMLVDGNLRISGNLFLDGSTNVIEDFKISFNDGISTDLEGTQQNQMHVNYKNYDYTDDDLKGGGFYISNDRIENGNVSDHIPHHGFMKVSDESIDRLSFRSIGHQNVISVDFSNVQTYTPTKNTLLVLKQNYMPTSISDISDNFFIRSSHCDNTIIDVSAAMQNIFDLSVNNDVEVFGSQRIHQTLEVDGDASFNSNVIIHDDLIINNNTRTDVSYKSSKIKFNSNINKNDFAVFEYFDATQDVSSLHYNGNFNAKDTSNSCLLIRTYSNTASSAGVGGADNMVLHTAGNLVLDTGLYEPETPSVENRNGSGNIIMLPYSNGVVAIGLDGSSASEITSDAILDVRGNINFRGNLMVGGDFILTGSSTVTDNTTFGGDLTASKNLKVEGETELSGNLVAKSDFELHGNITLLSNNHTSSFQGDDRTYRSSFLKFSSIANNLDNARIEYFDNSGGLESLIYREDFKGINASCLLIQTMNDGNNVPGDGNDNIIIRAAGNMVLDTGAYSDSTAPGGIGENEKFGGDILILPVGGHVGIGCNNPQVELDVSGDVSFNGTFFVRDQIGFAIQPHPNFTLSVSGDVSFNNTLTVCNDVSMLNHVYMKEEVGIGMPPSDGFKLSVDGDVSFSQHLDVYGDVSMHQMVRIGTHLGVGREPSRDDTNPYIVEISGSSKGLHIFESGLGTYGNASGGTITLEHGDSGGYSSIVFKNTSDVSNYGVIAYFDDANSSPVDIAYSNINGDGVNGTMLFSSAPNVNADKTDNFVIRPSGQLILDTGNSSSTHNIGRDVVVLPNGGNMGIGKISPQTTLDLNGDVVFDGSFYVRDQIGFAIESNPDYTLSVSGDVSFNSKLVVHNDVSFGTNLSVGLDTSIGRDLSVDRDLTIGRNVSITGNLTVTKDLHIQGNTTTIDSEVTTIRDPVIVLGDVSGTTVDDTWDRGIFFKHTLNGTDISAVGFFGYDKNKTVWSTDDYGVFRFRKAGGDMSNNGFADEDTLDQYGDNQEGTLLAKTYKATNAVNTVQLLLSDPGSDTRWCGITSRTQKQVYNVESADFKHVFTYGESMKGFSNNASSSYAGTYSDSQLDATPIAEFDVSGLTVYNDICGGENLFLGSGFREFIFVGGSGSSDNFYSNLSVTTPFIHTKFTYTPPANNNLPASVKIYGTNENNEVETIFDRIVEGITKTYNIYATKPYSDISFEIDLIQDGFSSAEVGDLTFEGFDHLAQINAALNVEGNSRFERNVQVDDRMGIGRSPMDYATLALEDVSNTLLFRTYVHDTSFVENALVQQGDVAMCWYDVSKNPANHFVLHPYIDNGGLTMDGSGNVGIHTRTTASDNYAFSVLGNSKFKGDIYFDGNENVFLDNVFQGVTISEEGTFNAFPGESYRDGVYSFSDLTTSADYSLRWSTVFNEDNNVEKAFGREIDDGHIETDFYSVTFSLPVEFNATSLDISGLHNLQYPTAVRFYGVVSLTDLSANLLAEDSGLNSNANISLPIQSNNSYKYFYLEFTHNLDDNNKFRTFVTFKNFKLSGYIVNTFIIDNTFQVDPNVRHNVTIQKAKVIADNSNNTLFGKNVQSIGHYNTAFGSEASSNVFSDGSGNTFLGAATDVSSSSETYDYSTALGYGAIIDASNQIVLGRSTEHVYIPSSENGTSSNDLTGLRVDGGVSIGGNLHVSDKFTVEAPSGNTFAAGTLDISGNFNVNDKFKVDSSGNTFAAGTLDVCGNSSFDGYVYTKGNVYFDGDEKIFLENVFQDVTVSEEGTLNPFTGEPYRDGVYSTSNNHDNTFSDLWTKVFDKNNSIGKQFNVRPDAYTDISLVTTFNLPFYLKPTSIEISGFDGTQYAEGFILHGVLPDLSTKLLGEIEYDVNHYSSSITLPINSYNSYNSFNLELIPRGAQVNITFTNFKLSGYISNTFQVYPNVDVTIQKANVIADNSNNTLFGKNVQSIGHYNTAFGSEASSNVFSDGSGNTFIGAATDVSSSSDTYDYSTALGYGAIIDASNQIVLGRSTEHVYIPSSENGDSSSDLTGLRVDGGVSMGGNLHVSAPVFAESFNASGTTAGMRYTFEGDLSSGIYYNNANTFSFYTNNIERLKLQNGSVVAIPGHLAIGQTSANYALDVSGGIKCAGNVLMGSQLHFESWDSSGHFIYDTENHERIAFFSSDNTDYPGRSFYYGNGHFFRTQDGNSKADIHVNSLDVSSSATVNGTLGVTGSLNVDGHNGSNAGLSLGGTLVKASAAELNILDGVTATTAELNYVDGVTSNIQDQIADISNAIDGLDFSITDTLTYTATNEDCDIIVDSEIALRFNNTANNNNNLYCGDEHHFHLRNNTAADAPVTAASFNATSDYRVKEDIQTISGDLYIVDHLRPVQYKLKHNKTTHLGFIAHEVQEHFPTVVNGVKDGEQTQSINYSELIPILVKEIQELKQENKTMKEDIEMLKRALQERI